MQHRQFNNESSMIGAQFAIDESDLIVWFKGGKAYRVHGAAIRADDFAQAESAGRFYNSEFKNVYTIIRDEANDA